MANLQIWTLIFVTSLSVCCVIAQDGRVFMNASRTTFNGNDVNANANGNVNIFLILQGTRNEPVDVTCQQNVQGSGYSSFEFTAVTIPTGTTSATMTFRVRVVGRPVEVTCFGQSVGVTCPSAQFCPATSRSDPVTMVVHPAPTISVCDSGPVLSANGGSFLVRFSPTVTSLTSPVTVAVTCIASAAPGATAPFTILSIPTVTRDTIEAFTVSYTVQQQGSPVEIRCSGQSQSSIQFQPGTSAGSSGIFSFVFGALYLYPRISTIYSDSFKLFLVRDPQYTSTAAQLQCAAVRFDNLSAATGELENPQCNPNQLVTPGWSVREPDFTLEVGTVYRVLEVTRNQPVVSAVSDIVVVRCCLSPVGNFNSSAVTAITVANLQPDFCSNCTGGPAETPLSDSRIIQNPAFQEVAPCPCNLLYQRCDINCCCDTDCSEEDKLLFEFCIPGRAGGLPGPTPFYKCDSQPGVERPDWFLVLCAVYTTSGYLGLFQLDTPGLRTLTNFNDRLTQQGPFYSYQEEERRMFSSGAGQDGYDSDTEIITSTHQGNQGIMALPQASAGGQCVVAAPIEFLQNSSATCQASVTADSCTANPLLSANSYAESEINTNSGCPSAYYFLQQYGVVNASIGPSFVSYYCPTSLADYVKNTTESFDQVAGPTVSSRLSAVLAGENCTAPCSNANCINAIPDFSPGSTAQPPLCTWSTPYTRPSPPTVVTTTCQNVVLGAHYVFTWMGQSVVRLDASIFMGNVALGSALSQRFSVEFQHRVATPTQNLTDNFLGTAEPYARSGKPGYDYGKPVWSGCEEVNQTTGQFLYVDTNSSKQMGLWQPGRDGLCANAMRRPVTFGEDTLASCALRLTLPDFDDCNALRQLIFNHMNSLLPSDVLGRFGYNDANNQGYWVNVQRDAINVTFEEPLPENATELYRGSCTSVVSGVKLLVLFAETGKTNGYPINEILGARVSYEQSDWSLSCMGPNALRCLNNTNYAESFLLTTAVQFIKVPATEPTPLIRFYTAKDPANCTFDSCYRFYEDFSTETCHYDICWWELAYPLTTSYTADTRIYSLGFTLATIMVGIGYFFISRPWF